MSNPRYGEGDSPWNGDPDKEGYACTQKEWESQKMETPRSWEDTLFGENAKEPKVKICERETVKPCNPPEFQCQKACDVAYREFHRVQAVRKAFGIVEHRGSVNIEGINVPGEFTIHFKSE